MIKKYFKYILFFFTSIGIFSINSNAKTEIVDINVTEVKSNYCMYNYDGLTIKLYGTSDGKMEKKIEGDLNSYDSYNIDKLENSAYINNRTCPNLYVYLYTMGSAVGEIDAKEKKVLYFFFNKNDAFEVFNTTKTYLTSINGALQRITTVCSYKATSKSTISGPITFNVRYNPIDNKFTTDVGGLNYQTQNSKITSEVKKNWTANETGIICDKDKVIIDFCSSGSYIVIRTQDSKMGSNCSETTHSFGITEASDPNSKKNLIYLSNICEEDTNVMKVVRFIGYLLVIVKILIPIGLIIIGIVNFSKAMISGNDDSIKKNAQSFAWKIVFAVIIFVLPTLINFIVGIIDGATDGTDDYINCRNCIFDPKNCRIP